MIEIRKAERRKAKLRVGMSGPSGSGKTYSALLVARGMVSAWEKVVLIDTENGSGELYSDLGPYNVITLGAPFTPERYVEAIDAAVTSGAEAIVLDSVSHEWDGKGGLLEANERLAGAKFKGNTWAAWSETTPRHQKFIEAIVQAPVHMLTTARSKTDTIQTEDKKIKKVGLKEIQREGFEYELTVNFNLDRDGHYAMASKDRTGLFIHRDPFLITQQTGAELKAWAESGIDVPDPREALTKKKIYQLLGMLKIERGTAEAIQAGIKVKTDLELAPKNYGEIVTRLEMLVKEAREAQNKPPEPAPVPEKPHAQVEAEVVPVEEIAYPEDEINPEDIPF